VQMDVIEVEYFKLRNAINELTDIERVMDAHDVFLDAVCVQCFFVKNSVCCHVFFLWVCFAMQFGCVSR